MSVFPKEFYWGTATSSYQVEGGIENCDWAKAACEGKVPVCGDACNHFNCYESDFDIAADLGTNAFRLSIEWARIEPEEGIFDPVALEHYVQVVKALKRRGSEPFVTLWHFTLPLWFVEKGGFERRENIADFVRYAEKVVEALSPFVKHIDTINEPMVWTKNGYIRGNWPPFKHTLIKHFAVLKTLALSHKAVYKKIKADYPEMIVGYVKDNIYFHSSWWIMRVTIVRIMNWFWNRRFVNLTRGYTDAIGLNYYFHKLFDITKPTYEKTDMGWDIYPEGLYYELLALKNEKVPLYVTENGLADATDSKRAQFITDHIKQVARAIENGVDVRGYFYWSLLDNFEWALGFEKRFGLVEINFDTQERTPRPSAEVYKQICERDGI